MKITCDYLKTEGTVKVVVRTSGRCYRAELNSGGIKYKDTFNDCEPYDLKTHIFYLPEDSVTKGGLLVFTACRHKRFAFRSAYRFEYNPVFADPEELMAEYDSGITVSETQTETVSEGVVYRHFICKDKNSDPVNAFSFEINPNEATLYVGTPDDGYENIHVKAKIPEMIEAAVKNSVPVVAAVNADFFDMLGDCHPSGLCVKNGRLIANADSRRPFIGIKKDGTPVITDTAESKGIIDELEQAAAGLEMILRDGEIYEWGPLEPFSFVRHPRTAAGIKKDGTVILLVVDGRIPEYSNGATLVDLALMMKKFGADRAINLDGGGSSIVYTGSGTGFELRNYPADLFRPRAKLIRKEFNALLVIKKEKSGSRENEQ